MKSPRDHTHRIAIESGHSCFPTTHLATCNRITAAIEHARAVGFAIGVREGRTSGGDSTVGLRAVGVSEDSYRAAVAEAEVERETT